MAFLESIFAHDALSASLDREVSRLPRRIQSRWLAQARRTLIAWRRISTSETVEYDWCFLAPRPLAEAMARLQREDRDGQLRHLAYWRRCLRLRLRAATPEGYTELLQSEPSTPDTLTERRYSPLHRRVAVVRARPLRLADRLEARREGCWACGEVPRERVLRQRWSALLRQRYPVHHGLSGQYEFFATTHGSLDARFAFRVGWLEDGYGRVLSTGRYSAVEVLAAPPRERRMLPLPA